MILTPEQKPVFRTLRSFSPKEFQDRPSEQRGGLGSAGPVDSYGRNADLESDAGILRFRCLANEGGFSPTFGDQRSPGSVPVYQDEASRTLPKEWSKKTQADSVNAYSNTDPSDIIPKVVIRRRKRVRAKPPIAKQQPELKPQAKVPASLPQGPPVFKAQPRLKPNLTVVPSAYPPAPPGVSLEGNMNRARVVGKNMPDNKKFKWFYKMVRNKGPWDFKQKGPQYEDFGNFHYGAVGRSMGFSESFLLRAAGIAQIRAGTSKPEWGHPNEGPPYGDDPSDQARIKEGYEYARERGY